MFDVHRASMLTKIPKIHVYSFKTLNARASGLNFPTPYWAWSLPWWFRFYSFKTLDPRAWGLHFPTLYWAWCLPWRWYQNVPLMFFHRASILTKIHKIHVYSLKTLDARASRLHFPTHSRAWGRPWECYPKSDPAKTSVMYSGRLCPNFIFLALLV